MNCKGNQVSIVLYIQKSNGAGERLQKIIEQLVPETQREIVRSFSGLVQKLRSPLGDCFTGVFLAADQQELNMFSKVEDLFREIRFILILPDNQECTISQGHSLRPRFISYADGDLSDVAAVLGKMLENSRRTIRWTNIGTMKCEYEG